MPRTGLERMARTTFSADEVLPLLRAAHDEGQHTFLLPDGGRVRVSRTLKVFALHGVKCPTCGVVGDHFKAFVTGTSGREPMFRLELHSANGLMTADHIVPLAKGGISYPKNLQPMCQVCNNGKGDTYDGPERAEKLMKAIAIKQFLFARRHDGEQFERALSYTKEMLAQRYRVTPNGVHRGEFGEAEFRAFADDVRRLFGVALEIGDFKWYFYHQ